MKYSVGIVGYGYVGRGMHRYFKDAITAVYDPFVNIEGEKLAKKLGYSNTFTNKESFKNLDLVIICVPTNPAKGNPRHEDFSIVESSIKWLTEINPNILILVKSAVNPLSLEIFKDKYNAHLCVSPEYLGEGKYFVPFWQYPDPVHMKYHTFQIFGGDPEDTSKCVDVFIKTGGPHVRYIQSNLKAAALCKYMENSWGAMKVTFCNEWYDIAKSFGVDYNELRELWVADSRVEKMHTAVFPKARGFGGKCYPKDVSEITVSAEEQGYQPKLMKQMIDCNKDFTKLNEEK